MSEAREKARALLADVATDGVDIPRALELLAALCDENEALEHGRGLAIGQRQAALANLAERDAQLSRQNAGLVQMARDRDTALAERDALRAEVAQDAALRAELAAEVKRLKAENAVLDARVAIVCECVKSRQGPMGGSIARPLPGCDECGGTGGIIVDGDA